MHGISQAGDFERPVYCVAVAGHKRQFGTFFGFGITEITVAIEAVSTECVQNGSTSTVFACYACPNILKALIAE